MQLELNPHTSGISTHSFISEKGYNEKKNAYSSRKMCSDVPRCFQCFVKSTLPVQVLLALLFKLGSVTLYPLQHVQLKSPMVLLQTEFGPQTDGVSRHSFTSKTMSSTMLY